MGFGNFDNKFSWWAHQEAGVYEDNIPSFGRRGMPANIFASRKAFMGVGAVAGGMGAGALGYNSPLGIGAGVAVGGLAGLAASAINWDKVTGKVTSAAWSGVTKGAPAAARGAWAGTRFAAKGGLGVAYFASKRPRLSAGLIGLAVGLGALALSGNRSNNASAETMSMIAAASGDGSLSSTGYDWGEGTDKWQKNKFLASTEGLVQGLHTARHRG